MEQKSISGMNKAAAQMGKKGGLAGKGATKRRGNASLLSRYAKEICVIQIKKPG